jgi:putative prophage lambdaCh01, transcriptional regulator
MTMPGNGSEIYRTCREQAGLTQEQAAEGLNCSVRQLARYEAGEAPVPDDIAYQMVVLYDSQLLEVQHLRLVSQVAADLLPPIVEVNLSMASLVLINRATELADNYRRMMQIAEDDRIDDQERPDYQIIQKNVRAVIAASFCYLYANIKKERPEAATSKRSVQGLASENNSKAMITCFARKCKPRTVREGVTFR